MPAPPPVNVRTWPHLSIRLPRDLYDRVRHLARAERRSTSNAARLLLTESLDARAGTRPDQPDLFPPSPRARATKKAPRRSPPKKK